jgi:hypothetical protein
MVLILLRIIDGVNERIFEIPHNEYGLTVAKRLCNGMNLNGVVHIIKKIKYKEVILNYY